MGEHVNKIREEVADMELLICTRVWEAWHYGTMSEDDFMQAADDTDAIQRLADIARTVNAAQVEAAAKDMSYIFTDTSRWLLEDITRHAFRAAGLLIEGDDDE